MRAGFRIAGVVCLYLLASGHVGSPDTWFEGSAGPYQLTVQIEPAGVVPGVAKVYVRSAGEPPDRVTVHANKFDATGGAPPPETASPVDGDPGLFLGKLWLMSGGSNSVTVNVSGAKGSGQVVVPLVVVAYSRLKLEKPMGAGLAAMGIFLFAGLVTIVGAAVREGSLAPGEAPPESRRRRAHRAMGLTAVLGVVILVGGWRWWNSEDLSYERNMYRPLASSSSIIDADGRRMIQVAIQDSSWIHRGDSAWLRAHGGSSWSPLIEDHGKIMHLFMVREDMSAFAHLHPETLDSVKFPAALPPMPAGKYRVFADIVHESGFTHTLTGNVAVTAAGDTTAVGNPDDSWFAGAPAAGTVAALDRGATITWERGSAPVVAGRPASLRFSVKNADGTPATLEPYMGMPAHAVVQRDDGSVFVHLHPMGTISVASQMALQMREPGDSIRGTLGKRLSAEMSSMQHAAPTVGAVSFPYAFPKAGRYRIWVQAKLAGRVSTAAFDVDVASAAPPR
jgi:hypothetical protein